MSAWSISPENGNATNPRTTAYTIPGGLHGSDLYPEGEHPSPELQKVHALELAMLRRWLSEK